MSGRRRTRRFVPAGGSVVVTQTSLDAVRDAEARAEQKRIAETIDYFTSKARLFKYASYRVADVLPTLLRGVDAPWDPPDEDREPAPHPLTPET